MLKRVLPFSITLIVGAILGSLTNPVDVHRHTAAGVSPEQHTSHSRTWVVVRSLPCIGYTGKYSQDARLPLTRLRVLLGADGTASKIVPVFMPPYVSPEEIINAAKNIEFTPATRNGKPVSVWLDVEYGFQPGWRSRFGLCPTIIGVSSEAGEPWRAIHE
jgi:hypothetical protein